LISDFTIPHPELAPPGYSLGASDLTFSPDGKTLAIVTNGSHSSLQLWEVSTGEIISTLAEHPLLIALPVNDKAFIGLSTGGTQLRDINTGEVLQDLTKTWLNLIKHLNEIGGVEAFAISPDATTIAIGSNDGSLQLWSLRAGNQISTLTGHTDRINALAFTADGTNLASSSRDKSIRLWDVRTGTQLLTLTKHINSGKELEYDTKGGIMLPSAAFVNNLVFSPDGRTLASASELGTIWLWELNTGSLLTTLIEHEAGTDERSVGWDNKIGLAFSPNSTLLASGGMDGQVIISEISDNPSPLILKGRHGWRVKVLVFTPDGKHLVSGSRDNSIRLWDVKTGIEFAILSAHVGEVNALAFSADGTTLTSGSIDGTILLWDWERIIERKDK
jgi:WD40 repeat protein